MMARSLVEMPQTRDVAIPQAVEPLGTTRAPGDPWRLSRESQGSSDSGLWSLLALAVESVRPVTYLTFRQLNA